MKIVLRCLLVSALVLATSANVNNTTNQKIILPAQNVHQNCYFPFQVDCLWMQNGNKVVSVYYLDRIKMGKNTTDCSINFWNMDKNETCFGLPVSNNITVQLGETVDLSCFTPLAKSCRWTRNDQTIALEKNNNDTCSIQIRDVKKKDLGVWECYVQGYLEKKEGLKRIFYIESPQHQLLTVVNETEETTDDSNISIDTSSSKNNEMERKMAARRTYSPFQPCKFNNVVDCSWKLNGITGSVPGSTGVPRPGHLIYSTANGKDTFDCSARSMVVPNFYEAECYGEVKWKDVPVIIGNHHRLDCYDEGEVACVWSKDGKVVETTDRYHLRRSRQDERHVTYPRGLSCFLDILTVDETDIGKWKCYSFFNGGIARVMRAYNVVLSLSKTIATTEKMVQPVVVDVSDCYFYFEVDCLWIERGQVMNNPQFRDEVKKGKNTTDCNIQPVFYDREPLCFGLVRTENIASDIGGTVVLSCYTPGTMSCSWTRNDQPLFLGRNDSDACAIRITSFSRKDVGIWECYSQTVLETEETLKRVFKLSVFDGYYIKKTTINVTDDSNISPNSNSSKDEGMEREQFYEEHLNIFRLKVYSCNFENQVDCAWRKNGKPVDSNVYKYVNSNGTNTTDCTVQLRHARYEAHLNRSECFGRALWQDEVVNKGSSHTLYCSNEGRIICLWSRNGIPIAWSDHYQYHPYPSWEHSNDCSITISRVNESDVGQWKCYSYLRHQRLAVMTVYNVVLSSESVTQRVIERKPENPLEIRKQCQFPFEVDCLWLHYGVAIPLEHSRYVDNTTNRTFCVIFGGNSSYQDISNVECGSALKTNNKTVKIGEVIVLECISAITINSCSWSKGDQSIHRKYEQDETCAIKISSVDKKDLGIWQCYTKEMEEQRETVKRKFNLVMESETQVGKSVQLYTIVSFLCLGIIAIGVVAFVTFRCYYQGRRVKDMIQLQAINESNNT